MEKVSVVVSLLQINLAGLPRLDVMFACLTHCNSLLILREKKSVNVAPLLQRVLAPFKSSFDTYALICVQFWRF